MLKNENTNIFRGSDGVILIDDCTMFHIEEYGTGFDALAESDNVIASIILSSINCSLIEATMLASCGKILRDVRIDEIGVVDVKISNIYIIIIPNIKRVSLHWDKNVRLDDQRTVDHIIDEVVFTKVATEICG